MLQKELEVGDFFEKEIGGIVWRLPQPNVFEARILQLEIGKIAGAPLAALMSGEGDDEEAAQTAISKAILSVDPKKSVVLIKDLCELTFNGAAQRKTDYSTDFSATKTTDIEVAVWVVESIFANFIQELLKSELPNQIEKMLLPQE